MGFRNATLYVFWKKTRYSRYGRVGRIAIRMALHTIDDPFGARINIELS